jgi:hypothetical protein
MNGHDIPLERPSLLAEQNLTQVSDWSAQCKRRSTDASTGFLACRRTDQVRLRGPVAPVPLIEIYSLRRAAGSKRWGNKEPASSGVLRALLMC